MAAATHIVSAAFFCPRAKPPSENYVSDLRIFLKRNEYGKALLAHARSLDSAWHFFADAREDIRALPHGFRHACFLTAWANDGPTSPICDAKSGIVALPLLLILQLGQYFRYLEVHNIAHHEFLEQIQNAGGVHGFCGGAAAAVSIACAKNEAEVVTNAAVLLRLTLGIGAAMEAAGDWASSAPTTIVIRLKHEGQGEELLENYPGTYISAVIEPKSISVVGPSQTLHRLANYAKSIGLLVHFTDITGKSHNPENESLAEEFLSLVARSPNLQLPSTASLLTPIRSNRNGEKLHMNSIVVDLVETILASKCEWYTLLCRVAQDLTESERLLHPLVVFGMDDCVALSPFHKRRLRVSKFEARTMPLGDNVVKTPREGSTDYMRFPDSAIAVIGASCRLPGADNLDEIWNLVSQKQDRHQTAPRDRLDPDESFRNQKNGHPAQKNFYGNFIDVSRFDNVFFGVNGKEAANMDPQQRLLLELSFEALESSGYLATHNRAAGDSVGCFIGASFVEYLNNTDAHSPTAYTSTGTIRGFLCGRLSYQYGWTGPSEVIDTACSSSLVAIHRACTALQMGECKMALAGGVNAITGINNFLDLGKAGFLSPTGQCKAFDACADGYCRAEGAGLVVLRTLKEAISNNDHILGVIPAVATNQGGLSSSLTVPSSTALQCLYHTLLDRADLLPGHISYIEAHATGTQAGDPIEMESIRAVFRTSARPESLYIGSIKGNIGHCETAAGVAGLLKVLAMLKHGSIPPQANYHVLNPKISPLEHDHLEIPRLLIPWKASHRTALVNSYGAAGSNCALLCCEAPKTNVHSRLGSASDGKLTFPLLLSAASIGSLLDHAQIIAKYLAQHLKSVSLANIAFTLNHRRKKHALCLEVMAKTIQDVVQALLSASALSFKYPMKPMPVVMVFSGQNDDSIGIDHTFFDTLPAFRSYFDACDFEVLRLGHRSLYSIIHEDRSAFNAVSYQSRLFAVQYACARCWIDAGIKPNAVIGHSFGEITALVISGVLSLADGVHLVVRRAQLIDVDWGTEKGAMLAIHANANLVERLLAHIQSIVPGATLEVACYNALQSTVIAGSTAHIEIAEQTLSSETSFSGTRFQRLKTSHAFHSGLVDSILPALGLFENSLSWNEPTIPLEFCTAEALPSIREWSATGHARHPVYFCNAIQRIENRIGSCVWLEAGLNSHIIPVVRKATSADHSHVFRSLDVKPGEMPTDVIGNTISGFWRCGISLEHWSFLSSQPKQIWLPPYQFSRSSHGIKTIDHAMEAHKQLSDSNNNPIATPATLIPSRRLVSLLNTLPTKAKLVIDSRCERYETIVGGHVVVSNPLCPASMYMECITMAIQETGVDLCNLNLVFERLEFLAPLGIALDRVITIELEILIPDSAWKFEISSRVANLKPSEVIHCTGRVSMPDEASLTAFARLIGWRSEILRRSKTAEKILSNRIYGLFSKVVHYEKFLRNIGSVVVDGDEAIATVMLADCQPGRDGSTAWRRCDAVLLDAFISIAGVVLNSSELVSNEDVLVAVAIERTVLTASCRTDCPDSWQVYAKFTSIDADHATSDIFVYDSQGNVVLAFTGVRFAKVPLVKLRKALMSLNGGETQSSGNITQALSSSTQSLPDDNLFTPDTDSDGIQTHLPRVKATSPSAGSRKSQESMLKKLLSSYIGMQEEDVPLDVPLVDLGIDSLSSLEVASELEATFGIVASSIQIGVMKASELLNRVESSSDHTTRASEVTSPVHQERQACPASVQSGDFQALPQYSSSLPFNNYVDGKSTTEAGPDILVPNLPEVIAGPQEACHRTVLSRDPFEALLEIETNFETMSNSHGFTKYWCEVAPSQNELLLAYILEAFESMGTSIISVPTHSSIPLITYRSKHERVVQRFWQILQKAGIVEKQEGVICRGQTTWTGPSAEKLHQNFLLAFPQYVHEAELMRLTGTRLSSCLQGQTDPISLMFGSSTSTKIIEEYYTASPMLSLSTELLVVFMLELLSDTTSKGQGPVHILEVGAGTGGTTSKLAEALLRAGIACQYTFTDIAPNLVAKARSKFAHFSSWMSFTCLDLEQELPLFFKHRFHVVIGTNCVHATRNRINSCRRLGEALTPAGVLVLSEVTQVIDWYDLCFGLLDGWWYAGNGTEYPLQPASVWMNDFSSAGFTSSGFSKGSSRESLTQQLLIATNGSWESHASTIKNRTMETPTFHVESMQYKIADGISIFADVYVPHGVQTASLPVAIMLHGGGHMTLSRKCVRPAQTRYLLANGFLPVSLDYRLCPEIDLVNGPMTDVRDGYWWARNHLPSHFSKRGIEVDGEKVVVIGWSTGGHLAMTLAWTTKDAGMPPPTAVLSFYAPTNLESSDSYRDCGTSLPQPSMSIKQILGSMSRTPITSCSSNPTDETNLGWLKYGDARSDLLLHIFKSDVGLPLLLNGLPQARDLANLELPSKSRIAYISPLSQLRQNRYNVPTFIVHGDEDNVAPFVEAERFVKELKARRVEHGFSSLVGLGHGFDIQLQPSMDDWEQGIEPGYKFLFDHL